MRLTTPGFRSLAALLLLCACSAREQRIPHSATADLRGTSWQLVKLQSSDEKTLIPDDKAKYTIAFSHQWSADKNQRAACELSFGIGTQMMFGQRAAKKDTK